MARCSRAALQWLLRRSQFLRHDQQERLEKIKAEAAFLEGLSAGRSVAELEKALARRTALAADTAAQALAREAALPDASLAAAMQCALSVVASCSQRGAVDVADDDDANDHSAFVRSYAPRRVVTGAGPNVVRLCASPCWLLLTLHTNSRPPSRGSQRAHGGARMTHAFSLPLTAAPAIHTRRWLPTPAAGWSATSASACCKRRCPAIC